VDVVTGLIKANFPTRIAFETTSRHDSRTILDTVGAEKLLGDGDMLHKPSGGRLERLHGAFVRDREITAVTGFWKAKRPAEFAVDFEEWAREDEGGVDGNAPGEMNNDPMYREAVEFVLTQGKASISLIQRRFRIGFNRAARYIEQMETDGMLGPQEGSKPRKVIAPK
jgi:S-DNA-T family DNA segregation ATPase FtsK/SpoIIIE